MSSNSAPHNLTEQPSRPLLDRGKQVLRAHGWLMAAGLIALLLVSAEGRRPEPPELAQRRKAIESLSPSELQQLQTNLLEWNDFTQERRESLHAFQTTLDANPELNATLKQYRDWLETISGQSKKEILAIADPQARAVKIAEIREREALKDRQRPGEFRPSLNRPAYDRLIRILSKTLEIPEAKPDASPEQRLTLQLQVVEAMRRKRDDGPRGLDRETMEKITEEIRPVFSRDRNERRPPDSPNFLFHLLAMGTLDEAERLVGGPISQAEKTKLIAGLSDSERSQMMNVAPDQQRARLIALALTQKNPELGRRLMQLVEGAEEARRRFEFDPSRTGNPGDRNPPPNDGPNGRPLDPRRPRGDWPMPKG